MQNKKFILILSAITICGIAIAVLFSNLESQPEKQKTQNFSRIISIAPNLTEMLFALDQGKKVVGVSDFCTYPPEATKVAKVGGFINPNIERITTLKPDLIVISGHHKTLTEFCQSKNIKYINIHITDINSIYESLMTLGKLLECEKQAKEKIAQIRDDLKQIRQLNAKKQPFPVFLCLNRKSGSVSQLNTCGGKTFLNEVLNIAGGKNIFADVDQSYFEVSQESLLKRRPQKILDFYPGQKLNSDAKIKLIADWEPLMQLPAIKNQHLYILTDDYLLIPGPRVVETAKKISSVLHK